MSTTASSPRPSRAEEFSVESDRAYVARAGSTCSTCRAPMDVICIYCERGTVFEEPLEHFTVQCVAALDEALTRQLASWPQFRFEKSAGCYLNHCPRCGASQDDAELHSEPGQPFFSVAPGSRHLELTSLAGTVRLSGDYAVDM